VNIEDLKKRKELIENNLKGMREKLTADTQNVFRVEGALLDISEIIKDEENKIKEEKEKTEKKEDKAEKKK
jgi:predicted  nucleic acid-binding Zn-ribbon protein